MQIGLSLFRGILVVHAVALLCFLTWYINDGYLGYGYGELIYVAMIAAMFVAIVVLLLKPPTEQLRWGVMLGILAFDIWFVALLARTIW